MARRTILLTLCIALALLAGVSAEQGGEARKGRGRVVRQRSEDDDGDHEGHSPARAPAAAPAAGPAAAPAGGPRPSCEVTVCGAGKKCVTEDGRPKCIPLPDACQLVACAEGKVCKNRDGVAKCLDKPKVITCNLLLCGPQSVCRMERGRPQCRPVCTPTTCDSGELCLVKSTKGIKLPECIPVCGGKPCRRPKVCRRRRCVARRARSLFERFWQDAWN